MRGEVICGYKLMRELGARSLPAYAAIDPKPRRPEDALCVVEQLAREPGVNAEAAAEFVRDAKRLGQIHHPNLVPVRDVVVATSTVLLVTDWIDGEVLSDIERIAAEQSVPIPLAGSLRILMDLLEGLSTLHELRDAKREPLRLVHAEVAPRNIVVGIDGRSVLVHPLRTPASDARLHAPEMIGYLAPEVLLGDQTADQRADVYGAGVLLWEALMGQRMHADGEDTGEIVMRILGAKIDVPCAPVDAPWAAPLAEAAKRAVAPDPSVRFANATEMLGELRRLVGARLAPRLAVAALVEAVAGERIRARNAGFGVARTVARLPSESAWTTEAPAPLSLQPVTTASDPDATKPPASPSRAERATPSTATPAAPSSPPHTSPPSGADRAELRSDSPPSSRSRVAPSWGRVLATPPSSRPSIPRPTPVEPAAASQPSRLSEPPTSADVVEVIELEVAQDKPSRPHQPPPVPRRGKAASPLHVETPMTQSRTDLAAHLAVSAPDGQSKGRARWTIAAAGVAGIGVLFWIFARGVPRPAESTELPAPSVASVVSSAAAPSPAPPAPAPPGPAAAAPSARAANEPSPFDPSPTDEPPPSSPPPARAASPDTPSKAAPIAPAAPPPVAAPSPPPAPAAAPAASSTHPKKRVYDPMGI